MFYLAEPSLSSSLSQLTTDRPSRRRPIPLPASSRRSCVPARQGPNNSGLAPTTSTTNQGSICFANPNVFAL